MPSFFDHYRKLGVQQFLIYDDRSEDGTRAFLSSQPDCVVLTSEFGFGDPVTAAYPGAPPKTDRWGTYLKSVIPRAFLRRKYALYVDADEFLVLPPELGLREVYASLAAHSIDAVAASLLEVYPRRVSDLDGAVSPRRFEDLIALYPYFDGRPLLALEDGSQPVALNDSASTRLFGTYGIGKRSIFDRALRRAKGKPPALRTKSATKKTPIVHWRDDVWLEGSHVANVPPTARALLTLAHFKFTHAFAAKIERAQKWRSHASSGSKYDAYAELLRAMRRRDGSFSGPASVAWEGWDQLERLGLARWDL